MQYIVVVVVLVPGRCHRGGTVWERVGEERTVGVCRRAYWRGGRGGHRLHKGLLHLQNKRQKLGLYYRRRIGSSFDDQAN